MHHTLRTVSARFPVESASNSVNISKADGNETVSVPASNETLQSCEDIYLSEVHGFVLIIISNV